MRSFFSAILFAAILATASAQETAVTNLLGTNAVRMIAPGQFELGLVKLDQTNRSLSFPAEINMREGLLEYLLVTTSGKTHESLLRTKADPLHIQLALLLLNAKPGEFQIPKGITSVESDEKAEPKPINDPSPVKLSGDKVVIEVGWKTGEKKEIYRVEQLLVNEQTKKPVTGADWIFNGSRVAETKFMAQVTGSIISLITDPDAVINNQAPGHDNDEIWGINTKLIPPVNHAVTMTIRVMEKQKEAPQK